MTPCFSPFWSMSRTRAARISWLMGGPSFTVGAGIGRRRGVVSLCDQKIGENCLHGSARDAAAVFQAAGIWRRKADVSRDFGPSGLYGPFSDIGVVQAQHRLEHVIDAQILDRSELTARLI